MKKTTTLIMVFVMIMIKSFSQSLEFGSDMNVTPSTTINENQSFQVSLDIKNTTGTIFQGNIRAVVNDHTAGNVFAGVIQTHGGVTINALTTEKFTFSTAGISAMKAAKKYGVYLEYQLSGTTSWTSIPSGSFGGAELTINGVVASASLEYGNNMTAPSSINENQSFQVSVNVKNTTGSASYGKVIANVFESGTSVANIQELNGITINGFGNQTLTFSTNGISAMKAGKTYDVFVFYYPNNAPGTYSQVSVGSYSTGKITVNASSATTSIKMGGNITGPASVSVGSTFTLQAKFRNDGNSNFTGTFDADIYEQGQGTSTNNGITSANDVTGITVNANSTSGTLSFTFNDVSKLVAGKKYEVKMWYLPSGANWLEVPSNGSYSNIVTISVDAVASATLEYGNNMTAPSSINENQSFQVSVNVKNTAGSAFYGKVIANVFESGTSVANIQELNGITINGFGNQTLTFSTNGISAMKAGKTYDVFVFYYPNNAPGTYSQVSVGSYSTGRIQVNANQTTSSLVYSNGVGTPSSINENQSFQVSASIKNNSATAFNGSLAADVFDGQTNIATIQELNGMTINGNGNQTFSFFTNGISAMKAGKTYDVIIFSRQNGTTNWEQISRGSFSYGKITVNSNQASVAKLEFGSNINAPSQINQGQSFNVSLNIKNVTGTYFSGNIKADVIEAGGSSATATIELKNSVGINGWGNQSFTFSTNGISAMLAGKKYGVYLYYQDNSSSAWIQMPNGGYNGAEITVTGGTQTTPTSLVLGSNITGPSSINQNQSFSLNVTIKNNGSIAYNGKLDADIYNSGGTYVGTVQSLNGITISGNGSQVLNFSTTGVSAMTSGNTYTIKIVYEPNGQNGGWVPVPNGNYLNAISINVNGGIVAGPSLTMGSSMIINPSDFKANTPFTVYVKIKNTSNVLFNGTIAAHVYDKAGTPVAGFGTQNSTINAGSTEFYAISSSSGVSLSPGTYFIKLSYRDNATGSAWSLISDNVSLKNSETISITTHQSETVLSSPNYKGIEADVKLSIYPNPSEGLLSLNMDIEKDGVYTIEVYNLLGGKVYTEAVSLNTGAFQKQIDLSNMDKGIYVVNLSGGSLGMKTQQIILK